MSVLTRGCRLTPIPASAWVDGAPQHVSEATVAIDQRIASGMRCKQCKRRGLRGQPQHFGSVYRVLCKCPQCNATEEL